MSGKVMVYIHLMNIWKEVNSMYANLRKEILDKEGKVVFRKTFSLDMETTTEDLLKYFTDQGYVVDGYTDKRIY
jgi:hypothetical protein